MSNESNRAWLWIALVVLLAGAVRLTNINWDQTHFFHPDERAVVSAVQRITFKPLNLDPDWFNYGTLPIYIAKITSTVIGAFDPHAKTYDGIIVNGRATSAVIGTLTVLVLIFLGRRLYGLETGLLAGLLLAVCFLHVQNSRFLTVDVTLTFFVLLALSQLTRLCEEGRPGRFLGAGFCIGLALATKFSAMPLFLPLGIAALFRWREDGFARAAGWTLLALLAAVAGFAFGEPYGLLNFSRFYRDVAEQSVMVRNAGAYPYTTQYMHLTKYWYEVEQLVLWCMAPLLGLTAVWATASRPLVAWRSRRAAEWVLLSWVVPFFLVTGWFEVKFPRYLLPIYPVMILWAADALMRLRGRRPALGRLLIAVVVGGTLLHTVAFVSSTYTRDHTVVEASRWTYRHVPAGSKILSQDWDEGFPMGLPEGNAGSYKVTDFGYYGQPDNHAKMVKLAKELASTDYIIFQTKRLYGATTRAPERYPLTNNYFYQLFAGDLGFTLIHEMAARPSLFGFEIPDELADESLTVYDHPKVLFFQNTGRLTEQQLLEKITNGLPSKSMTRDDLLRASPADFGALDSGGSTPAIRSSVLAFVWFAALVEALGFAGYFLLRRWLPTRGAYALAKTLGVLVFAYLAWILVSLGVAPFTGGTLAALVVALLLAAWLRRNATPALTLGLREVIATEAVFWAAFLFFAVIRMYNPEVFWGEKPMDFSFLNAMNRATTLPPPEPWFAGSPLHYSYFGYFLVAALGKTVHIHPGLTFNLGIALMGGLTTVSAFALGTAISQHWRTGVLAALFATLIGNLSGPGEAVQRKTLGFDYFWATSRVIRDTINEYPLWSFLFADLHAHVMVMPITLSFLTLTVMWVRTRILEPAGERRIGASLLEVLLLGLTLGAIIVTNAWSTPTYVLFFPFLVGSLWLTEASKPGIFAFFGGLIVQVLLPAALIGGIAYLLYLPFWAHFVPPERNFGWELHNRVIAGDFFLIFGLFLFILVPFVWVAWGRMVQRRDGSWGFLRVLTLLLGLGLLGAAPVISTRALLASLFFLSFAALVAPTTTRAWRIPLAMATFAFAITAGCDVVWVWDRMNTIFKFYLESWFLLSVAAAVATAEIWKGQVSLGLGRFTRILLALLMVGTAMAAAVARVGSGMVSAQLTAFGRVASGFVHDFWFLMPLVLLAMVVCLLLRRRREARGWQLWTAGFAVLLSISVFTGFTAVHGVLTTNRVSSPKPTLDGTAYLKQKAPYELAAYDWINERVAGIPVLLEAQGDSYGEFTRVSMNTGLPTVLGWAYHVFQRAHPWSEINLRKADIETAFTSDNKEVVAAILERYHVALIFVGNLERRTYAGGNLERFNEWKDLVTPVYQNEGVTLFAVNGRFRGSMPVSTIEDIAPVEGVEASQVQDAPGRLQQPRGIGVSSKGEIYVADFGNHRIQEFAPDLKFVRQWGKMGDLPGQFKEPCGLDVAPNGDVLVADTWNHRVQQFAPDGKYVREWSVGFYGPRGVTAAPDGRVYVTDTGNNRISRFSADGKLERTWGSQGKGIGQFTEPMGIAVDRENVVYVCDNGNSRLQAFTMDGQSLFQFPVDGWESKVYSEPDVVVDPEKRIWVTVPGAREIRAYDRSGKVLATLSHRNPPDLVLDTPMSLALDPTNGTLVVSDLSGRILRVKRP